MEYQSHVKRTQKVLFDMGCRVAEILEESDIPYFITLGTLLGAVRHKGFIPWDDDFDFHLFDDSYEDAIKLLRRKLPSNMFVEDEQSEPLYFHAWAHVKDLNSEAVNSQFPQDGAYTHKGVSLDLYRAKKMMFSEKDQYIYNENYRYLIRRKEKGLISEEEFRRRMELLEQSKKTSSNISKADDYEVYNILLRIQGYSCARVEDIFPLRRLSFEGHSFLVPHAAEKILTSIYGDYMKLPPEKDRKAHYSQVVFFD